jgi:hypothetical protein
MLHAVFLGDTAWCDYAMGADVRIRDEHDDSRAGLIFRSTPRGFYLFRIHRETDKAQLAYHSKHPFGWFILGERALGIDVDEAANRMEVWVSGERIVCRLNGATVFNVVDKLSTAGRAGFYSVESHASFDNLAIDALGGVIAGTHAKTGLRHFWFTDTFTEQSTWWRCVDASGAPRPWLHIENAGVQPRDGGGELVNRMERFELEEYQLEMILSLSPARETGSRFGIVLGSREEAERRRELRLEFSSTGKRARLVACDGAQRNVLGEGADAPSVFGATTRLHLTARRRRIECALSTGPTLAFELAEDEELPRGTFGVLTSDVRLVVHRLTIAALRD